MIMSYNGSEDMAHWQKTHIFYFELEEFLFTLHKSHIEMYG